MMTMTTPAMKRMSELSVDDCFAHLRSRSLGRLAYVLDGRPRIVPLNYAILHGSIVFRTGYGHMLDVIHNREVAFEVDHGDPGASLGWSVVVQGVAEEIWRPEELDIAQHMELRPWAPGNRDHYVQILSTSITGREIS
jgi:hypothetical protein